MSTLKEIISLVKNPPDRGLANRATELTDRMITAWINEVRGFLITKSLEKLDSFPVSYQQDLGCWPLEQVDQADCPAGWIWGDDVKRATFPDLMEVNNNMGLAFFGLIDKVTQIYVPAQIYGELDNSLRYKGKSGYLTQMIGCNTIYLRGPQTPKLKTVNIRGVFKNPTLVDFYANNGIKYCYDADTMEYPIPSDLVGYCVEMVWKRYLMPWVQAPRDNTNVEKNEAVA